MLHIAAADIGGTNSRFAHFSLSGKALRLHRVVQCPTADLHSTEDALTQAAATGLHPSEAAAVVWAVAGPVHHPLRVRLTNADVDVDLSPLAGLAQDRGPNRDPEYIPNSVLHTDGRVVLCINDFIAQAWATLTLPGQEAVEILPPSLDSRAANTLGTGAAEDCGGFIGVVGAGTGLGTASLLRLDGGRHQALPAEGGHTAFPWRSRREAEFGDFLCAALDAPYACGDQVLSGRGLALLHHFLTGKDWPVERVAAEALGPDSPTLRAFARFYGRFCRHWVLQTLCTRGLYLTGGVAVKNPRIVRSPFFAEEFYDASVHMLPLLRATPVRLMTREHAGLWGAARCGVEESMLCGGRKLL